ncbi:MAG: helix-turn-helix domain-containing protein [Moorellales bacterium]
MDRRLFAQKLRRLRLERGYSNQYALAAALGTTRAAVNAWESARYLPSKPMLEKIAQVLGCPLQLLTEETHQALAEASAGETPREDLASCSTLKDVHATLGRRIAYARKLRGLTQAQLADRLGVDHRTVAHWEANTRRPDPGTLREIAMVLDVSADYLLGLLHEWARRIPSALELGAVLGWWSPEEVGRVRGIGDWQRTLAREYEEQRRAAAASDGASADAYDLLIQACRKTGISYVLAFQSRKIGEKIRTWCRRKGCNEYEAIERLGYVSGHEGEWAAAFVRNQDWVTLVSGDPKDMMVNEYTNQMFERLAQEMGVPLRVLLDDAAVLPEPDGEGQEPQGVEKF